MTDTTTEQPPTPEPSQVAIFTLYADRRVELAAIEPEHDPLVADILESAAASIRGGVYREDCTEGCAIHQHKPWPVHPDALEVHEGWAGGA